MGGWGLKTKVRVAGLLHPLNTIAYVFQQVTKVSEVDGGWGLKTKVRVAGLLHPLNNIAYGFQQVTKVSEVSEGLR